MYDPAVDHQIEVANENCTCGKILPAIDDPEFWIVVSTHIGAAWLAQAAHEMETGQLEVSVEALKDFAELTENKAYSVGAHNAKLEEFNANAARHRLM